MIKEGLYEAIISEKIKDELDIKRVDHDIEISNINSYEARDALALYVSAVTREALSFISTKKDDKDGILKQIEVCNEIIEHLSTSLDASELKKLMIHENASILLSVYSKINKTDSKPIRPKTPLSKSSLFTGAHNEPSMYQELKKEILTSNRIDFLISFIKWSGLRMILGELKRFTSEGNHLRIITTSYMEATDYRAVEELMKLPNTEIKVSYDTHRTRLHAKSYMFKRDTGFSTAYIGSSNISNPALSSGLEWNLKISERDSFHVIVKMDRTFESYWNDPEYTLLDSDEMDNLKEALKKTKTESDKHYFVELRPFSDQKEVLEKLEVEREIFDRRRNLIVAPTGVGKTMIAAFDYKRVLKNNGNSLNLLFVAHREEILKQSIGAFRMVLKDYNFGEMMVGSNRASTYNNLFTSIQSFNSKKLDSKTSKDFYDYIVIDEFHHAAAKSYRKLLDYYKPKYLIGLTATPERMDGQNVLEFFDDRIASEMRLTSAIDKKLLSPFQYFAVTDSVDLSSLKWKRKGYDLNELSNVYTENKVRASLIVDNTFKYLTDVHASKGLGFCVSKEHAVYMADFFNKSGIPSIALTSDSNGDIRSKAKDKLIKGEINFIFVVDLYNEGVDIPEVDTILFLRPTESLTVFLQQLGRGLRLSEDKECLTVLDFVGQAHKSYNFEEKFRALIGRTRHSVAHYLENGFFNLPKGCYISLEKQAKEYILRNVKDASNTKKNLVNKLKYFSEDTGLEPSLLNFTRYHNLSIYEVYGSAGNRSFYSMLREAEIVKGEEIKEDFVKKLKNLFHLDSIRFINFIDDYLNGKYERTDENILLRNMLYYSFYAKPVSKEGYDSVDAALEPLKAGFLKKEILYILEYLKEHIETKNIENGFNFVCPLDVHGSYNRDQILSSLGYFTGDKAPAFREGVKYFKDKKLDIFLITLNKDEKDFTPTTLYEDYAINDELFHWQSQSGTSVTSLTGMRYLNHKKTGNKVALFVREYKKEHGYSSPYVFLGEADYVSHSGNKPISIIWKLKESIPAYMINEVNKEII